VKIIIETIPHAEQRYPTAGDWQYKDGDLLISVSESGDWRSNALVAVHELVEALLCTWYPDGSPLSNESTLDGIVARVDAFDKAHLDSDEPGDEPDAPYRDQHCFAMAVERMMCAAMGASWKEHEARLEKLK
jgi:hypothetical protein